MNNSEGQRTALIPWRGRACRSATAESREVGRSVADRRNPSGCHCFVRAMDFSRSKPPAIFFGLAARDRAARTGPGRPTSRRPASLSLERGDEAEDPREKTILDYSSAETNPRR
jgi:hypothetical protein